MRLRAFIAAAAASAALASTAMAPGRARAQPSSPASADARLAELNTKLIAQQSKGATHAALRTARELLRQQTRAFGAGDDRSLSTMLLVGALLAQTGDYVAAAGMARSHLAAVEARFGDRAERTATALEMLAGYLWFETGAATPLYQRALEIRERGNPQTFGYALMTYAAHLASVHRYSEAVATYRRAADQLADAPGTAASIHYSLSFLHWNQGDAARARDELEQYLTRSRLDNPDGAPDAALTAALLYKYWGNPKRATELLDAAEQGMRARVTKHEGSGNLDDPLLLGALRSLGQLLEQRGRLDDAYAIYRRLSDSARRTGGEASLVYAGSLFPLAEVARLRGDYSTALATLRRAHRIYEGPGSSGLTRLGTAAQLANVYRDMKQYGKASRLIEGALRDAERSLGARNPVVTGYREYLGSLHLEGGSVKAALPIFETAYADIEQRTSFLLTSGTEADNRAYLATLSHQLSTAIALQAALPRDPRAARLGILTVLRSKGRALDAAAGTASRLRSRMTPADRALLDELSAARNKLAKLVVAGPQSMGDDGAAEFARAVAELEREIGAREREVRKRSAEFRLADQPIDLAEVQRAIPASAALVEIVHYRPYAEASATLDRTPTAYGAYVLGHRGAPRWVDLGAGAPIDRAVGELQRALSSPDSTDVRATASRLYAQVMKPLESELGGARVLLIAPDGPLNLTPFGALIDGADAAGQYLVRKYTFAYLTSGRDLLRMQVRFDAKAGAVVVADPAFDDASAAEPSGEAERQQRGLRSRDLRALHWDRLPGTAREAREVAHLLAGARLLAGDAATEEAVKQLSRPRILHLATHGFFLPAESSPASPSSAALAATPVGGSAPLAGGASALGSASAENPLLRSGLVFAGANRRSSGRADDGVLTALEAADLDLFGTQLVVLSACETAVGSVRDGDGVYGLRRALVIAGAESLVMSLWQVDDEATRDLMTRYYRGLAAGRGRSAALRAAQLELLDDPELAHPYYWASFIPAGQWTPLRK